MSFAQALQNVVRVFTRSPAFACLVVATVALGVGANVALFSMVRGVLLRPLAARQPEALVRIFGHWQDMGRGSVSPPEYRDLAAEADLLQSVAAWSYSDANLADRGEAEHVRVGRATASLLGVLGTAVQRGRWFTPAEEAPKANNAIVLTDGLWQRAFAADPSVIGRSVRLDGRPHTVVGVLPRELAIRGFDAFVPLAFTPEQLAESARGNHFLRVLGRVPAGGTAQSVQARLELLASRLRAGHPEVYPAAGHFRLVASPLLDEVLGSTGPALWMLFAAVLLVLVIACANVAGLMLARSTARAHELAVRAALGADRLQLAWQLMIENLVLALVGGALGLLLAEWGRDVLLALVPRDLPRLEEVRTDGAVLAFALVASLLTGAGFGLVPALAASRADPQQALRSGKVASGPRPARLRAILVAAEVALALVLLAGASLLLRSFTHVLATDPGFQPAGAAAVTLALSGAPGADAAAEQQRFHGFVTETLARARAAPGVSAAGAIDNPPFAGWLSDQIFFVEGVPVAPGASPPDEEWRLITPGYLEAMGIPLLRGRRFEAADAQGAPPVVLVSKELERRHFGGNALGRRIRVDNGQPEWWTVIGVIGDVRADGLDRPARPTFYLPVAQTRSGRLPMTMVARSSLPESDTAAALRSALASREGDRAVYDARPISEWMAASLGHRRFALVLLDAFAVLAMLLAALGLYGVLSQSVEERRREIGVRMALGARSADVVRMILKQSALVVGAGLVVGGVGAVWVTRFLSPFLFDVDPLDPLAIGGAALGLVAAAGLAAWLPAHRATHVDPMAALRAD